jgi:hypothetical protein
MTRIHGQAAGSKTRTYRIWQSMVKRCHDPKSMKFKSYGGRGITVCERWRTFTNFLADMGECPIGMSLDRRDNNLSYSKENCRWATVGQQARNTSRSRLITYNGETLCLRDWERCLGLGYGTLWRRLAKGEPIPHALRGPK